MLNRNGSHMSTQTASMRFLCRLTNSLRKNSSSVSFFRSLPNHSGSPVSRLHTTVRNLPFLPRYNSSTPICRNGGSRPLASHRSRSRRSIARTVPPRQSHASSYLPRRRTLACQAHRILEALAERGLAGQQRYLLDLHAANRAFHSIHLYVHGGRSEERRVGKECRSRW